MTEFLNLSLFQTDIIWQSPDANIEMLNQWIENIPVNTDMVLLPEMFSTGFSMDVQRNAQSMDGIGVSWLKHISSVRNITIAGSLTIEEDSHFYNRMIIASPNGPLEWYNKRHLFRMGNEDKHFASGDHSIVFNTKGWNIMPLVCYDLRFPVWSRNTNLKYDLLIYIANWPQARSEAFLTLLKARAIENQSYVVGVNRVGEDGNGVKYVGQSVVIDPKGRLLNDLKSEPAIINCSLSLGELQDFRKSFPAYLDADSFEIK